MERYFELHNPKFQTTLNSAAFDASDWRFLIAGMPQMGVPDRMQLLCLFFLSLTFA
jgi:hypothetical protein